MSESAHPRPPQRKAPLRLYTVSGWIEATLHVPEKQPLLDFLNGDRGFLTLTDVSLPQGTKLPFLALSLDAVILIQPSLDELVEASARSSQRTAIRQVSCLFPGGMLMGSLPLPEDTRVSDEMMNSGEFFLVGNCTLGIDAAPSKHAMEASAHLLLHARKIIGVAEIT